MTRPDITPYVDLTLYDRSVADLLNEALALIATRLPGWTPREGSTEMLLLEQVALLVSEQVYALNRVPAGMVEVLLGIFGVPRDLGAAATATLTFTALDTAAHTVPAGTIVLIDLGGGGDPVQFVTTTTTTVTGGAGTATAVAAVLGTAPNGVAAGASVSLVTSLSWVNRVTLAATIVGGRDPEADTDWYARGLAQFGRLTSSLVLAGQFTAYALTNSAVFRATTLDQYNPAIPNPAVGKSPGHVTVAVIGSGGVPVPDATKTALAAQMQAMCVAGLTVHVVDITVTSVNVTTTVLRDRTTPATTVTANVTAALAAYLNPDSWPFRTVVPYNELIARIDAAAGVDVVVSVTVPAADLPLPGAAPLASLGSVSVTVQDPT